MCGACLNEEGKSLNLLLFLELLKLSNVVCKSLPLFLTSPLLSSMVKCSANSDKELSMLKRKV